MKKALFILTCISALFAMGAAIFVLYNQQETNLIIALVPIFISLAGSNLYIWIKYQDKM